MQVIPIAGKGSRFKEKGYELAKYLLPIYNKPVIENILEYFDKEQKTLIILNKNDNNFLSIDQILKKLNFKEYQIVEIDNTSGQLVSVYEGILISRYKNHVGPFWIYNGDTIRKLKLNNNLFTTFPDSDGFIEVFKNTGGHWSFVDKLGIISEITEKKRISEFCSTGLYGFKNLQIFREVYEKRNLDLYNDELYVSSILKKYIQINFTVRSFESKLSDFILCGTPTEYELEVKKSV